MVVSPGWAAHPWKARPSYPNWTSQRVVSDRGIAAYEGFFFERPAGLAAASWSFKGTSALSA